MLKKYRPIIYGHSTTWHDGNVAMLNSGGKIIALASERVDRRKHSWDSRVAYEYLKSRFPKQGFGTISDFFKDVSGGLDKTGHHLYHAASAFFGSPYEKAGVLVVNGQGPESGKIASTTIWRGDGDNLELVEAPFLSEEVFVASSVGHFYTAVGAMAGMQSLYEEGKTMGLAAYGRPSSLLDFIRKYVSSNPDGSYFIEPDFIYAILGNTFGPKYYGWKKQSRKRQQIWEEFIRIRGRPIRKLFENVSQEDMDAAYAGQVVLEEIVTGLAKRVKDLTGSDNICLSGGVALNGVTNTRIRDTGLFSGLYTFPASGDGGQAIGKLFYEIHRRNLDVNTSTDVAFYGPWYRKNEVGNALKKFKGEVGVVGEGEEFTVDEVADRLSEGKVVGRFVGSSEIGPRALGHRSILADPRKELMRDYINFTVKSREWYRPLAPTVIEERSGDFFEMVGKSPFMSQVTKVIPEKKKLIPSVTHVDGSARVQTINPSQDLQFYRLIKRFCEKTGIPLLLNTSFNRRNEPLVESPEHALEAFINMDLDSLILEDFLVVKRP